MQVMAGCFSAAYPGLHLAAQVVPSAALPLLLLAPGLHGPQVAPAMWGRLAMGQLVLAAAAALGATGTLAGSCRGTAESNRQQAVFPV
jgi:hypothetical protein